MENLQKISREALANHMQRRVVTTLEESIANCDRAVFEWGWYCCNSGMTRDQAMAKFERFIEARRRP